MPFKLVGKEIDPIFVFAKFWSIHSKVVRLGKNAHSKQKKNHFHTNSAVSCQVYLHALLVQHL